MTLSNTIVDFYPALILGTVLLFENLFGRKVFEHQLQKEVDERKPRKTPYWVIAALCILLLVEGHLSFRYVAAGLGRSLISTATFMAVLWLWYVAWIRTKPTHYIPVGLLFGIVIFMVVFTVEPARQYQDVIRGKVPPPSPAQLDGWINDFSSPVPWIIGAIAAAFASLPLIYLRAKDMYGMRGAQRVLSQVLFFYFLAAVGLAIVLASLLQTAHGLRALRAG